MCWLLTSTAEWVARVERWSLLHWRLLNRCLLRWLCPLLRRRLLDRRLLSRLTPLLLGWSLLHWSLLLWLATALRCFERRVLLHFCFGTTSATCHWLTYFPTAGVVASVGVALLRLLNRRLLRRLRPLLVNRSLLLYWSLLSRRWSPTLCHLLLLNWRLLWLLYPLLRLLNRCLLDRSLLLNRRLLNRLCPLLLRLLNRCLLNRGLLDRSRRYTHGCRFR